MTYMQTIFSFHFQTRYTSSITWRCSVRISTIKSPVTAKQSGDRFAVSNAQHIHPADLGRRLKAEVSAKVRKKKKRLKWHRYGKFGLNIFTSTWNILIHSGLVSDMFRNFAKLLFNQRSSAHGLFFRSFYYTA